ncbi:MAG: hypothetical protein JXJ17_01220 [Anaerolineae bacterium]|nr:hypothetical protein [Anaerolineae bacterium]
MITRPRSSRIAWFIEGVRSRARAFWGWLTCSPWGRSVVIVLVVGVLTLTALHPLFFGSLPSGTESTLHLTRLIGLSHAGKLWPRFLPGLGFGYGLPLFVTLSPLYLLFPELFHLLGMSFVGALLLSAALYTIFGALGAYRLGESWGGPLMGLVTTAAFVYSPYLLILWAGHGALSELLALALLAWNFFTLRRVAIGGRRGDLLLGAVLLAALLLADPAMSPVGFVLLFAYALALWWISPDPHRAFLRLTLAILLGAGLAAFFWVPALVEGEYLQLDRLIAGEGFATHFQSLRQVFSLPQTADLTRLSHPDRHPLGWPQLLLALAGAGLVARKGTRRHPERAPLRHWLLIAAPLLVGLVVLTLPASGLLWKAIPRLQLIRYPRRMISPASLILAAAAGSGMALAARRLRSGLLRGIAAGGIVLLLIIYSLPWLYTTFLPNDATGSIVDAQNIEREQLIQGAPLDAVSYPRWVTTLPDADRLTGLYAESDTIPRLQPNPAIAESQLRWDKDGGWMVFVAEEDTTLVFDWFYFPGWWALLDNEPVTIRPNTPDGLISIAVPEGIHLLEIGFSPTRVQLAAGIVSGVMLVILLVVLLAPRRALPIWSPPELPPIDQWPQAGPVFAGVLIAGLLAFSLKALVIDNIQSPFKTNRYSEGMIAGLDHPVDAVFGEQIRLIGYDLPDSAFRSGQSLPLTLYWTPSGRMIPQQIGGSLLLRDSAGIIVSQLDFAAPGGISTTEWVPGFYVSQPVDLPLPPGTPPGVYTLQIALDDPASGYNLGVIDAVGQSGILLDLAAVEVVSPRRAASTGDLEIGPLLNANLDGALTLVTMNTIPTGAEVGQPLPVIWVWRAREVPSGALDARLIWIDGEGEIAAVSRSVPPATGYPTDQWRKRDVWRGAHMLHVPGSLDAGRYDVAVQLVDAGGQPTGDQVVVGSMTVSTPPRSFELPPMQIAAAADWANGIRLLGYDLPQTRFSQGDGLHLTLYYQPQQPLTDNLTSVVQLIDEAGQVRAQWEQIPANGSRPTTGWAPGEVVDVAYGLVLGESIPPGSYRLRVGWKATPGGAISALADGGEFYILPQVIVIGA